MKILVGGTKGGTGKTTVSVNLAAWLAKAGRDVLLVDTDRQCSAEQWAASRSAARIEPAITCVSAYGDRLADEIRKLARKYDHTIIDAGGFDSIELRASMTTADLMIAPCRPGAFDFFALVTLDRLIGEVRAINPRLTASLLLNFMPVRGADESTMRESCEALGVLRPLGYVLHQRRAYSDAAGAGKGVIEWADDKASAEIEALAREVFNA